MEIMFGCRKSDQEFINIMNDNFEEIDECENFSFSGMEELVLFIVPIAALTLQVADFVRTHVSKPKNTGRVVIIKGKKYSFEGYTSNEIVEILKELQ